MARPKVEAYVERNAELVQRYQSGVAVRDLAGHYGLEKSYVRQILRSSGVSMRREPRLNDEDKAPIDDRLLVIGVRLQEFQLECGLSRAELAAKLKLSEQKILDATRGRLDWRYTELVSAAHGMGTSFAELTAPPRSYAPSEEKAGRMGCSHTPSVTAVPMAE